MAKKINNVFGNFAEIAKSGLEKIDVETAKKKGGTDSQGHIGKGCKRQRCCGYNEK